MPERCLRDARAVPSRPHFLGRRRYGCGIPLADEDTSPLTSQQEGGGQAADAATDDYNICHKRDATTTAGAGPAGCLPAALAACVADGNAIVATLTTPSATAQVQQHGAIPARVAKPIEATAC
jgi:hypothetical protein